MLPSSELAAGVVDSRLAEPHLKLLISHFPRLLLGIAQDWITRLSQVRCGVDDEPCDFLFSFFFFLLLQQHVDIQFSLVSNELALLRHIAGYSQAKP